MCYNHTTEYYSTIKRNEVLIHETTWINSENIINVRSQTQRPQILLHLYEILEKGKSMQTEGRLAVSRSLGEGLLMCMGFFGGDKML